MQGAQQDATVNADLMHAARSAKQHEHERRSWLRVGWQSNNSLCSTAPGTFTFGNFDAAAAMRTGKGGTSCAELFAASITQHPCAPSLCRSGVCSSSRAPRSKSYPQGTNTMTSGSAAASCSSDSTSTLPALSPVTHLPPAASISCGCLRMVDEVSVVY